MRTSQKNFSEGRRTSQKDYVTWCFTPSQPVRLYQGEFSRGLLKRKTSQKWRPLRRKPSQKAVSMSLWTDRSTAVVGRLTKTKLDKLRSYTSSDSGSNFTVDFWSYSKTPLRQSLTLIHNPAQEETAIKMFNCILIYSGIEESSELGRERHTGLQLLFFTPLSWLYLSSLLAVHFLWWGTVDAEIKPPPHPIQPPPCTKPKGFATSLLNAWIGWNI